MKYSITIDGTQRLSVYLFLFLELSEISISFVYQSDLFCNAQRESVCVDTVSLDPLGSRLDTVLQNTKYIYISRIQYRRVSPLSSRGSWRYEYYSPQPQCNAVCLYMNISTVRGGIRKKIKSKTSYISTSQGLEPVALLDLEEKKSDFFPPTKQGEGSRYFRSSNNLLKEEKKSWPHNFLIVVFNPPHR